MNYAPATRNWEAVFDTWGQAPSQTEQQRCENAERGIKKALGASNALTNRTLEVFPQGSYANHTNVRQDSDVDICVLCRDTFYFDLPPGTTAHEFGLTTPATYTYDQYKSDVEHALAEYFDSSAVARGNKAFDVHANTYRVDADVVPCFEYRSYIRPGAYHEGTKFSPDQGGEVINWPKQNYDNGVRKNTDTHRRFKAVVRTLKRLRNEMVDAGLSPANPIPSYLIECLAWNVPNEGFVHETCGDDVRYALAHLRNETRSDAATKEWGEINELKYLFRPSQPWTLQQAHAFLDAAWTYVGFH